MGFLIFVSHFILLSAAFFVWPSRHNIPYLSGIGFIMAAYFVPLIIDDEVLMSYPDKTIELYLLILLIGAIFFVVGVIVGFKFPQMRVNFSFYVLPYDTYESRFVKLTRIMTVIGITGMVISFILMGFVPMFAADPFSAKFFRGAYEAQYMRVAILYRFSNVILISSLVFIFALAYHTRKLKDFFLAGIGALVIISTLTRGPAVLAVLTVWGVIASFKGRKHVVLFVLVNVFILLLGALSYFILGYVMGVDSFQMLYRDNTSIWKMIQSGAPDVSDQLQFINNFISFGDFTYGRTFYGGLIPGHYPWNPSVWGLSIMAPNADLSEIDSGGLRLPAPIWGYVSFSWLGVVTVSLVSGFITGYFTQFLKRAFATKSFIVAIVSIVFYQRIGRDLAAFYVLSYTIFPTLIFILFYLYRPVLKRSTTIDDF